MDLPIPQNLIYAGLAGCVLSLIVATATNNWQLRVFFLLALRLAIGWHFFFEGMHKIHSHTVGPTETNRPFTSEPYFAAAEGPLGDMMRKKYIGDPAAKIAERVTPTSEIPAEEFARLTEADQARNCPAAVAQDFDSAIPDAGKAQAAKAAYARWVYGVDAQDTTVKFIEGDVALAVPPRLQIIGILQNQVDELEARSALKLGRGYGHEKKLLTGAKSDLRAAQTALASDADAFMTSLKKSAGAEPDAAAKEKPIAFLDRVTMWTITIVGACLIFGVATPLACIVGAGFLLMTYLSHPTVPWLPLPPNTEGNPLFINKNIIEMLALLVIAVHPSGRWLGLDALLVRLCPFCRSSV